MIEALFWILVGALIGWNVPQPFWAKYAQEQWLKPFWNKLRNR